MSTIGKGSRVSFSWDISGGLSKTRQHGTGTVISNEEDGRVLVAQDPTPPEARHFVIHCTVTWLTLIEGEAST